MKTFKYVFFLVVALICSLTFLSEVRSVSAKQDDKPPKELKVTICHRTNSPTNPYTVNTVDESSVNGQEDKGEGNGDHLLNHIGPVFDPSKTYPNPRNGDDWGDIIPPFYEDGTPRVGPTLNWPEGAAIFRNQCNVPKEQPSEEKLVITNICSTKGKNVYSVTNTNDHDKYFNVTVDGVEVVANYLVPANSTVEITVTPYGVTEFIYKLNSKDEIHEVVKDSGKICVEPTPTPDPCDTPATDRRGLVAEDKACPSPTPTSTPTATPTSTPNPSPAPQSSDVKLTYSCSDKRWNVEVTLRRNNAPVTNAVVEYSFYSHKDNRRTDNNGINNFPFADEGKGLLKVYPETFAGSEITLDPPSCAPSANEPQAARSRVLGASTMFADTGTAAETLKAQIAFVFAVVASAVAIKLARKPNNA